MKRSSSATCLDQERTHRLQVGTHGSVLAPTTENEMPACYKMLEIVSSSAVGLSVMTSFMATKSATPTKPSPVQDRDRTPRSSPQERASRAPSRTPPPYPAQKFTRESEWNPYSSKKVFQKFKADFEKLHCSPIDDVAFSHFKLVYTSWAQNSRE